MYLTNNTGILPTASICINKSRLKIYNETDPTVYLNKGQEFQIELFNPTTGTILAKIYLNGKIISQGGLVLRPGERVFLDRYIDVPSKFKFDTYEVENSAAVQKAIQDNGDFKVEFYKEQEQPAALWPINNPWGSYNYNLGNSDNITRDYSSPTNNPDLLYHNTNNNSSISLTSYNASSNETPMDWMKRLGDIHKSNVNSIKKSIETGRVEKGSHSSQKFEYVQKSFQYYPFHTVEYKLLPLSQKQFTTADIKVKQYCTNCGSKVKQSYKYCPACSNKL